MVATVRISSEDLKEDKVTFVVTGGTLVQVPRGQLEKLYKLGVMDPDRVSPDGTVQIPVIWLVGGRVGY
jgi:hypothetical protein